MMEYGNGLGFGFGFGGMLWALGCVLLIAGLVVLVAWAVSRATTHDAGVMATGQGTEAHDILRARLARGEISEAEYVQAGNVLRSER